MKRYLLLFSLVFFGTCTKNQKDDIVKVVESGLDLADDTVFDGRSDEKDGDGKLK